MKYGYARVSTREQKEDRQLTALRECGIEEYNIFIDKQSGKNFERQEYQILLKIIQEGDVIVIKSLDRLGRNYREMIKQWQYITQEVNADIIVLDMELLDTTRHKDLLGTLISEIVLQLLSYVAESERVSIMQRQAEGIITAKARGVRFGRPVIYNEDDYLDIFTKYHNKEMSLKEAKALIGCSKCSFYKMFNALKESGKLL